MTVGDIKSGARQMWHRTQVAMYSIAERNDEIRFEEEGHRYFYKGQELPSVTRIVEDKRKKRFYSAGSGDRGHDVHAMCILDAQGILDESTVVEEYRGYLSAWWEFRQLFHPEFLAYEVIVANLELGYAGRCDLMMKMPKDPRKTYNDAMLIYLGKTGTLRVDHIDGIDLFTEVAGAKQLLKLRKRGSEREGELWV